MAKGANRTIRPNAAKARSPFEPLVPTIVGEFTEAERARIDSLVAASPLVNLEAKRVLAEGVVTDDRFVGQLRLREIVRTDELRALGTLQRNQQRALEMLKLATPPSPKNPFDLDDEKEPAASPSAPRETPDPGDRYAVDDAELKKEIQS